MFAPFPQLLKAYRETLGKASPQRDIMAVLSVYRQCAEHDFQTQTEICRATGLSPASVNKIIDDGCAHGWIDRDAKPSSDGTKRVALNAEGRAQVVEFDRECSSSVRSTAKGRSRPAAAGVTRSRRRSAQPDSYGLPLDE